MNKEKIDEHLASIKEICVDIKREVVVMEVCGGHTNTVMKYGLREALPSNLKLISGPGCPVCVSSQKDIDNMIGIARSGVVVATYGDMMRVPGSTTNLEALRGEGAKIHEIYSTTEVMELRKKHPDIVFFGVGFETTAPMTAYLLKKGVVVYSVHKTIPNALKVLAESGKIDGFIDPGHVSTIIGSDAYKDLLVPQAITGFGVEQVLRGIKSLLELIRDDKKIVVNAYQEVVKESGNPKAKKLLDEEFVLVDSEWRGLGVIPESGLEVRSDALNAKVKYKEIIDKVSTPKKTACRCGDVLMGIITSVKCPLYRKSCTPKNPVGACMVSEEGSCQIYYKYGK
ncbi:hydrogenase formation protein HypD [Candidatus Woesearchaeota archaeon]|nr:hydrogenase formation protein HypD [Candidatus Woesearchaeota archaeon]